MKTLIPTTLPGRILLASLLLGVAWERIFYGHPLGLGLILFLLLLLGCLNWLGRSKGIHPRRRNLWLLIPLAGLALLVALRAESGLHALNLCAILGLLALLGHFFSGGRLGALGIFDYPALLAHISGHSLFQAAPLLPKALDGATVKQHGREQLFPLIRGTLLALPLLAFFALLLLSADLVFAAFVDDFFSLAIFDILIETTWRSLLILLVAWVLAGGLAYALLRARPEQPPFTATLQEELASHFSLGFGETATVLSLVNALFLGFVWIQFAYLFGGRAQIVLEGFTYAEYARRGFFELVAVALTTLALLRGLQWLSRSHTGYQRQLFNALGSLMIALVLVMLLSAFQRLRLYEAAFGYTRLRLMVHLFIIWLGLLLGWQALTLWWHPGRQPQFALAALVAALGFLLTLNVLNPDALIARQNLARFEETGKVDAYYLTRLSADAMPELVPAVSQMRGENQEILCRGLRWHQAQLAQADEPWTSFNLGRWQARRALEQAEWQTICPPLVLRS